MQLFQDTVGVVLHIPDQSTPYFSNWAGVLSKLGNIKHVRDSAWNTTWGDYARIHQDHRDLAALGVTKLLLWNPQYGADLLAELVALKNMEGSFLLEGPNELDINPGGAGWPAVYNQNLAMLSMAQGAIPIVAPSLTQPGSISKVNSPKGAADFANLHTYWSRRNPETGGWGGGGYGSLAWNISQFCPPGMPIMMTETGYGTDVPDAVRVQYMVRLLLNNWQSGIYRTYLYQFVAGGTDSYSTYGLLNPDLSPRPEYLAIQALLQLIGSCEQAPAPALPAGLAGVGFGNGFAVWQPTQNLNPDTLALTPPAMAIPLALSRAYGHYALQSTGQWTFSIDGPGTVNIDDKVHLFF